jgi:CRP-like cAMP-binding protein
MALITLEPRSASIVVISESAKCLKMTKDVFEDIIRNSQEIIIPPSLSCIDSK